MSTFYTNQIVWAKVRGHPWWPAIVLQVFGTHAKAGKKEFLVNFIGDNSHATVGDDKIVNFDEKLKQFSNVKNRKLQEGIKAAQRIYCGESTYEEERGQFERKKRKASSSIDIKEDEEDEEFEEIDCDDGKSSVATPKKRRTRKPSISNPKKDKEDLEKQHPSYESLLDFIPNRVTRAQCKDQHIEVLTEPLLYLSKKTANLLTSSGKKERSVEKEKEEVEYSYQSRKASIEYSVKSHQETKQKQEEKDILSSQNSHGENTSCSTTITAHTAISEESQVDTVKNRREIRKVALSQTNIRKKIILSQTVDKSEAKSNSDKEEPKSSLMNTEYCCNIIDLSPKFHRTTSFEQASKPKEINNDKILQEDNGHVGIDKFEANLEHLLNVLTKRLKQSEVFKEDDLDISKLFELLDQYQRRKFIGSELSDSKVGKIMKTIQYVFTKHKNQLPKKAQTLIRDLSRLLNELKETILKFCLDNTGYMELLHLKEEQNKENNHPKLKSRMEIEVEEPKCNNKVDTKTPKCENKTFVFEEPSPVTTKLEDTTPRSLLSHLSPHPQSFLINLKELQNFSFDSDTKPSLRKDSTDSFMSKAVGNHCQPGEVHLLRKKVCHRIIKLLQDSFKLDKEKAQELTLKIEGKIHDFNSQFIEDYKQSIQNLYKLIKIHYVNLSDVYEIKEMTVAKFNEMMQQKIQKALENGAFGDQGTLNYQSLSADILESPSLKGLKFDMNLISKFEHIGNFTLPPRQISTPKGNDGGIMSL